jgi:uncharacterized protein (DUF488 family)
MNHALRYRPLVASRVAFTVGYEGRTLEEFITILVRAGVERVVDVRALPLSRRRGFSKTALGNALSARGIEYRHVRAAGNPYRNLRDDPERCLSLYAKHLDGLPEVLDEVEAALSGRRSALLCFEAKHDHCHRSVIAERLGGRGSKRFVKHL